MAQNSPPFTVLDTATILATSSGRWNDLRCPIDNAVLHVTLAPAGLRFAVECPECHRWAIGLEVNSPAPRTTRTPKPDTQLLADVVDHIRNDPRIRSRHVRVELRPGTFLLEIGGQQPPWWCRVVDPDELRNDPQGCARRIVDAWAGRTGSDGTIRRVRQQP